MNIAIFGEDGMLGRALSQYLKQQGHTVTGYGRGKNVDIQVDLLGDTTVDEWQKLLTDKDVVIYSAGLFNADKESDFYQVHDEALENIILGMKSANVSQLVYISAQGVGSSDEAYFDSKHKGEKRVRASGLNWNIIRPTLVFSENGASAKFFATLARLPAIFLPRQQLMVQPVHINDVVRCVEQCIEGQHVNQLLDVGGKNLIPLTEYFNAFRSFKLLSPQMIIRVPRRIFMMILTVSQLFRMPLMTPSAWKRLEKIQGHNEFNWKGDTPASKFLSDIFEQGLDQERNLFLIHAISRLSLGVLWILTAVFSVGIYPIEQSLLMLNAVGLGGSLAIIALYSACLLDLILGLMTLFARCGKLLWIFQLVVITFYSFVIGFSLPEYIVHPFGPITKNICIVALIVAIMLSQQPRKN